MFLSFTHQQQQLFTWFRTKPVKALTAGIVSHRVQSPKASMTIYDLAGHKEYHSSHSSLLEAISITAPSIFLLLVNLLLNFQDSIIKQIHYWSAMIGDVCHKCPHKSSIIVVGTHEDKITDRRKMNWLQREIERVAKNAIEDKKQLFVKFISLNATAHGGANTNMFISLLRETNDDVRTKCPAISPSCHVLYAFLNDRVPNNQDAITLSELETLLEREEPKVLPTKGPEITPLLKVLSNIGLVVFFDAIGWIVLHQDALLEKVNGALFAPEHFTENLKIASNTGVIPIAVLKHHFSMYNIDMIVQFLIRFELCQQITVSNVITNLCPKFPLPSDDGQWLFFPALINSDIPREIISSRHPSALGWIMYTHLFLSPRFLHVLILRLAYVFCLPKTTADPQFHNLDRHCKVWKNGISWKTVECVEVVVEVRELCQCYVVMSFPDARRYKVTFSVLQVIRDTCKEYCPCADVKEAIVDPLKACHVYTEVVSPLSLPRADFINLRDAIVNNTHFVLGCNNETINVSNWTTALPQINHLFKEGKPISDLFGIINLYYNFLFPYRYYMYIC